MSRRWKIAFALFVLGMGGLLVWAFRLPLSPPVTVHFLPYELNNNPFVEGGIEPTNGTVTALFVVSNTTTRVLSTHAHCFFRFKGVELKAFGYYYGPSTGSLVRISGDMFLAPGQSGKFRAGVPRSDEPLRIVVEGRDIPSNNTFLTRLKYRLRLNRHTFSLSATNEPP